MSTFTKSRQGPYYFFILKSIVAGTTIKLIAAAIATILLVARAQPERKVSESLLKNTAMDRGK